MSKNYQKLLIINCSHLKYFLKTFGSYTHSSIAGVFIILYYFHRRKLFGRAYPSELILNKNPLNSRYTYLFF